MDNEVYRNLRHNYLVNLGDGAFFGFAIGFASFSTILPLFVSTMTNSALLIGLVPALHVMGWQLPQLLTAPKLTHLSQFRPFVVSMSIQERLPFLGLAVVAAFLPVIGIKAGLVLTFIMLTWQGLGGGLTANGWQNMIARVIPSELRATFFGIQSAVANLLASISAIVAGLILDRYSSPYDFTACFLLASLALAISWIFLRMTRESERITPAPESTQSLSGHVLRVLRQDKNFVWFLLTRVFSQFATMAFAFYIVFAVNYHGMDEVTAGIMTSVLLVTQTIANPVLGWLGDHWSRRRVIEFGAMAALSSALIAAFSPSLGWFYAVFILTGIANTAFWTIGIAYSLEFGTEEERPVYVGMANTLIAPAAMLAPMLGGWLADLAGYKTTFIVSALAGLITILILHWLLHDPTIQSPSDL
jgi:MFS family permease